MISPILLWIPALVLGLAGATGAIFWLWKLRAPNTPKPLPANWLLSARPVFSTDERRLYRLLREALPHHVILAKLPLVRFSQPDDPNEVRYWYELLGTTHVAFAISSTNGRVLAAIDLDSDRTHSRRTLQIKQAVLAVCRVRYLRCPVDSLPTVAELQSLVPQSAAAPQATSTAARFAASTDDSRAARSTAAKAAGRVERNALWQESALFNDSFFALENRPDATGSTDFGSLDSPLRRERPTAPRRDEADGDDIAGIVSDERPDPPKRQ